MKPLAVLLAVSVAAIVGLLAASVLKRPSVAPLPGAVAASRSEPVVESWSSSQGATKASARSAVAEEPQPVSSVDWHALRSGDLRDFAANLRRAGVPEHLVRAMVSAEIDARFRDREKALSAARPTRRYWEADDAAEPLETRLARLELRREKAELKTSVLGLDATTLESAFDSPIPAERREMVRLITQDYESMINDIRGRAGNLLLDSEKKTIAYIEQERRNDLAAILSPSELADWEMINSNTFRTLRRQLSGFQANEEEFRLIYEIQRDLDERFRRDGPMPPAPSPTDRQAEERARTAADEQLRSLLGESRFAAYTRGRDREYQALATLVQRVSMPETTAIDVFAIRETVTAESNRIYDDRTIPMEQKRAALQALAQNARSEINTRLGGEVAGAYFQVADRWLKYVEEGGAVRFGPQTTYFRSLNRTTVRPPGVPPPVPPATGSRP
jgi:hypothetical protein